MSNLNQIATRLCLIVVFAMNFTLELHGQKLSANQTKVIRNTITHYLGKEANLRVLENGKAAFIPIGKDTFFNIHGLRYVFQLKGDSAIRMDKSIYHGSNFYRYLFEHEGKIMALGGYGMFITNHNLEAFNPKSHEWYLIQTYGDIPKGIKGTGIKVGQFVYILNNLIDGDNVNETILDKYHYRLDLRDMHWTRYKLFRKEYLEFVPDDFFYLKDYVVAKGEHTSFIYKISTLEFIYHTTDALGLKYFNGYNTNIDNNSLKVWILDTAQTVIKLPELDIEQVWNQNRKRIQKLDLEPSLLSQYMVEFGLASTLLLGLGFLLYRKQQKSKSVSGQDSQHHPLIEKLFALNQSTLSLEELDDLLEIAHMEGESKKTKRHRLLAVIETQCPGLIVRHKDSTDKRRFLYFIQKNEA